MAKSIRAKAKMANRKKKREQGNYHAADAARVARLSAKLLGKQKEEGDDEEMVDEEAKQPEEDAEMVEPPKKISTSAPRDSRREQWRESKGMAARPKSTGQNRQGMAKGRRNAGKPKRRR
ncbi:hypothetical protein DB88DRAFT_487952 [Papiliotrema laurentii]|uniref:DUF2423 domain-containing protein n=1 Tax=Papiliotrema laurentii TaxID=5418 RepID=A0AAD9L660_PAPLA|nr:hypothetical protein DB88DRAFT_487952 [Papiliotrema laurentii]